MSSPAKAKALAPSPATESASSNTDTEPVILGKIGTPYGLQGWLKVQSYTHPMDNVFDYPTCWVGTPKTGWQPFEMEEGRCHGKGLVIHFAGYDTPEQARVLTNQFIGIARSALPEPEPDEYYWHDLIGLSVINLNGECLGKISRLFDTGPHDILVIEGEQEHLIPYVRGVFVKSVSLTHKQMTVDWQPDAFTYR